jgi:hypothetical protein
MMIAILNSRWIGSLSNGSGTSFAVDFVGFHTAILMGWHDLLIKNLQ